MTITVSNVRCTLCGSIADGMKEEPLEKLAETKCLHCGSPLFSVTASSIIKMRCSYLLQKHGYELLNEEKMIDARDACVVLVDSKKLDDSEISLVQLTRQGYDVLKKMVLKNKKEVITNDEPET